MSDIGKVRLRLPSNIKTGDVVRVRCLVIHPMERIERDKAGKVIDKKYQYIDKIGIRGGRGYVSADRHGDGVPAGAIWLDAAFSPIRRVNYQVEMSRLGNITDYEKLVVEITTDGSISPDHAFLQASKLLRDHFDLFTPAGAEEEDDEPTAAAASAETTRES